MIEPPAPKHPLHSKSQSSSLPEIQNQILEQIARGKPLLGILNALVLAIEGQFERAIGSILLCDGQGKLRSGIAPNLPAAYSRAVDGIDCSEGNGSCGTAAFRAQPVIVSDTTTDPLWHNFKALALEYRLKACWSVPIIASDGKVLGTFAMYYRQITSPAPSEIEIVVRAANIAAIALERTRAIQAMKNVNQQLEAKVAERTTALYKSQQFLQEANEKLSITNNELLRATRLKDEFLANMSHELRTPLNAILGMSEGLQEEVYGSLNERQQKSIGTIERSGRHLLELINDILTVSKMEAGKLELEIRKVNITKLCNSSLSFVKQQAMQKRIRIETNYDENLGEVAIDERRIRQVLINLLNNAVKFTSQDGHIKLAAYREENSSYLSADGLHDSNDFICISVTDTGMGIAAADLVKLFQPFVQINSNLNRQHEGTGLGLTLVKQIVELHGGSVEVNSKLGQGSCFTIRIPNCNHSSSLDDDEPEPSSSLAPDNNLVLIVEDSVTAAEQVSRYLNELGMTSHIHPRGEETIETVLRIKPALIILDIILPNQSGWETLQQLKTNIRTKDIPVIVASVMDERPQGMSMGAAEFLVKPFTRDQLHSSIKNLRSPYCNLPGSPGSNNTKAPQLILLAEDNQANIETFSAYLEGRGYELIAALNGQEAVQLATTRVPDLILMDIQMPKMDGLTAMRHIRANPQLQKIPIIALTALAMPGDREKCIAAGANEYLTKPIKLKDLATNIQKLLVTNNR